MKLKQTVKTSGNLQTYIWSIDRRGPDYTRVGDWGANYWFTVKTGETDKATLGNARRALTMKARNVGILCSFEYIESRY